MIKQATLKDVPSIEAILLDAVEWLDHMGMKNTWTRTSVLWDNLEKNYHISDFYIIYEQELPVACMAITDHDATYWPKLSKGASYYIHKVAVKRQFAGKGYSSELLTYAKQYALDHGIPTLRLDCDRNRPKLRKVYENQGFVCVKECSEYGNSNMALYVCNLNHE